jgi:hypothetical protein
VTLGARRSSRGGFSAYDTIFVDVSGKITLRASLDGRTETFRASDIHQVQSQGSGARILYFSPTAGNVNAVLALSFQQVREAFMLDYGKFAWQDDK